MTDLDRTERLSDHVLSVTANGDWLQLKVVCREPVGAPCRQECVDPECSREDRPPHDDGGVAHPVGDQGACHEALWLNEDDVPEAHDAGVNEPLRDGMPIVVDWDGDGYTWRGAPEPAEGVATDA